MVKKDPSKEIKLSVAEAQQDDVNKGIVRIDSKIMKSVDINPGDLVEIKGSKKTLSIAGRAFPADLGEKIIRMDPLTRRNAKTSIGERVSIVKREFKPVKKVTLAPIKGKIVIRGDLSQLKKGLMGRVVSKGDLLSMGGTRRRKRAFSGSPFEDIFDQFLSEDNFGFSGFGFSGLKMMVVNTHPKDFGVVTEATHIDWKTAPVELKQDAVPDVAYEDIGGLEEEIKKVREMIELPLKHPEVFDKLGVQPPKGVLLYGPPGTGKTLLAKAVANESGANFFTLNGPEIMSKFVGQAEKKLRKLFEDASKSAPSIVFIDEIDAIASKRDESYGEVERRVVAQLLATMDGMKSRGRVVVIAATNRQDALDPALRRSGRFDREIEIGVPDRKGRENILKIHTRNMPLNKKVNLKNLAARTYGFVGADLQGLTKEAAMNVIRRVIPNYDFKEDKELPKDIFDKLYVKKEDFEQGLKLVQPSAMREVLIEIPNINWKDIGGLEKAKIELREAVELPMQHPKSFKRLGIRPPRGVLLYGPPGTGKTLLAKAVANESGANFISVKGPEIVSKWVGESEKAIRKIFSKARQVAPSIIFFDEIDSIASSRSSFSVGAKTGSKIVNQILTEMDGMEDMKDVVVMAATNRPELVDSALLRPGRFDRHILIGSPDEKAREEIFKLHTKNMKTTSIKLKSLAKRTENYSGADIEAVCREAAMLALRRDINAKKVTKSNFDKALKEINPSLKKADLRKYERAVSSSRANTSDKDMDYMG